MAFLPLTDDDNADLEADREFLSVVLERVYPDLRLIGTSEDVEVLQHVLDGSPYSDQHEAELVALGTCLGDLLATALELEWCRCDDEYGIDLGLRYQQTSLIVFPRDMIVKRVERDEQVDLQMLYDGSIQEVQRLIESGEYQ